MRHSTPLAGYVLTILASVAFAQEAVPAPAAQPSGAVTAEKQLVSYSLQYEQLPVYAGTPDSPNQFSINLLKNLGDITGVMPIIRVGGTTQDDTVYHAGQTDVPVYNNGNKDQGEDRVTQYIGPGYFDSYTVFPNTTYIAGLNLARQGTNPGDGSSARQSLLDIAQQSCAALGDSLHLLEMGNEPDLFVTYGRRDSPYTADEYVSDWKDAVAAVRDGPCGNANFFGNSFTGAGGAGPKPLDSFNAGQNDDGYITEISEHNYMRAASGADLQNDLMSHSSITSKLGGHISLMGQLSSLNIPYTLGETNSLYGGKPAASGLSDVMGAALWSIDFTLYAAANNIRRLHFHQAVGNPYNSWVPTSGQEQTMAAYYGNIFTARFVGPESDTAITNIPLGDSNYEAAYAAYTGGKLARVALVNMRLYNANSGTRATKTYDVQVGTDYTSAKIERLQAPGADSTTGLTFGGMEFEAGTLGVPAQASGAPSNSIETVQVVDGVVSVVTDSTEAVLITLS